MKLHEIKLLAAAVSLVAIATTVALASTMHTHATSAQQSQGAGSKAARLPFGQNDLPRHGILTCGLGSTATACETIRDDVAHERETLGRATKAAEEYLSDENSCAIRMSSCDVL